MPFDMSEIENRLAGLRLALKRLSVTMASIVEEHVAHTVEAYRLELRRIASVLALSLAAALLGFASLTFVAFAVMVAYWPTHPGIASALIAAVFAALALLAAIMIRGRTETAQRSQRN